MNVMRTECYMLHVMITAPLDLFDGLPQGRSQAGKLVVAFSKGIIRNAQLLVFV